MINQENTSQTGSSNDIKIDNNSKAKSTTNTFGTASSNPTLVMDNDFVNGSPCIEIMEDCFEFFSSATHKLLNSGGDTQSIFDYGPRGGDKDIKEQLSKFLSDEYGDQVESNNLMITQGATQGFHLILTLLVPESSPVFFTDPTYFQAPDLVRIDMRRPVVAIPSDEEGPLIDEMEEILIRHRSTVEDKGDCPFWAAFYLTTVFHNPLGISYSEDRCRKLVTLARKHNILLLCDDVYNMMYVTDRDHAPKRLLQLDSPSDPDFTGGNVLSNCTFSKILAPGCRVGWIEGPPDIIHLFIRSTFSAAVGCFNHYTAQLLTEVLRSGQMRQHMIKVRSIYKRRISALCNALDDHLPDGCSYKKPEGGVFVWIQLRPETDIEEFLKFSGEKHKLSFKPGVCFSLTGKHQNCVRLSTSFYQDPNSFCLAYRDFLHLTTSN